MFLADTGFRSLCEDYRLAAETLAKLRRRSEADSLPRIEEYRRIMTELELEIATVIQSNIETG